MEINVGDYVRTKWGIARLTDITTYPCNPFKDEIEEGEPTLTVYYIDTCFIPIDETRIWKEDIIKSSSNIIDLIEVGDIIFCDNKKYAINYEFEVDYNDDYKDYEITIDDYITLFLKDGLSIVTKEQFESMKYKIGE